MVKSNPKIASLISDFNLNNDYNKNNSINTTLEIGTQVRKFPKTLHEGWREYYPKSYANNKQILIKCT